MIHHVKILTLPGGRMPERKTDGAIGYDVSIRAIVSPSEMDPNHKILRKTLFDFERMPDDPFVTRHIIQQPSEDGKSTVLVYEMEPQESILVGIGFCTEMNFPLFYWVAPRSGLSSRYGLTVTNAPGTVDPDYRGEAGVLVYNRNDKPFRISRGMRIAQVIFQEAVIPSMIPIDSFEDFSDSKRGTGGFGSTGLK